MLVRILPIWFLFLYAMSSPLGLQLMKIPIFIDHYQEHKAAAPHISLVEFIEMHYFTKQHDGGDFQRDMQLPFKTVPQNTTNFLCLIKSTTIYLNEVLQKEFASLKYPVIQEQLVSLGNINSIWQPPRA